MKEAYVSLILPFPDTGGIEETIKNIDLALGAVTRNHEIIIVNDFYSAQPKLDFENLTGPVTIILTNPNALSNYARVAGFGRAVGDFIIEWQGNLKDLNGGLIVELLEPTNTGAELVEYESQFQSVSSHFFYKLTNSLRPSKMPIRKVLGRSFSRRALGLLLTRTKFEPQVSILFAELPVHRVSRRVPLNFVDNQKFRERIFEGFKVLLKGSRFGTVVPLILSTISGLFGFFVAIYACVLFIYSGKSPEGWTTLMVVIGLGQASILALIGMTWSRIDSISRGMSMTSEATSEVIVYPSTT
jgi:hypothetical protein